MDTLPGLQPPSSQGNAPPNVATSKSMTARTARLTYRVCGYTALIVSAIGGVSGITSRRLLSQRPGRDEQRQGRQPQPCNSRVAHAFPIVQMYTAAHDDLLRLFARLQG